MHKGQQGTRDEYPILISVSCRVRRLVERQNDVVISSFVPSHFYCSVVKCSSSSLLLFFKRRKTSMHCLLIDRTNSFRSLREVSPARLRARERNSNIDSDDVIQFDEDHSSGMNEMSLFLSVFIIE